MKLTSSQIKKFQKTVYSFYKKNRRDFAWRNTIDPYKILVSEIMLQQTQTDRVKKKYAEFIKNFPNFTSLARAPLKKLLQVWQGMGYNRRALALQSSAQQVIKKFNNKLPSDPITLQTFKGIGPHTAASICAFAFNQPTVFIETNIRSVYIHYFFPKKRLVHDKQILPLVAQTVDATYPREWYYALMDYGVHLKKLHHNPSRRSVHHTKQSKFEGSDRQIRGNILKLLLKKSPFTYSVLKSSFKKIDSERFKKILTQLQKEKFITQKKSLYFLN